MKKSVVAVSCSVVLLLASCGSDSASSRGDSTTPATATTSTAAPASTSSLAAATSSTTASITTADATIATVSTMTPTTGSAEATVDTTGPATIDSTDSTDSTDPTDSTGSTGTAGPSGEYSPVAAPVVPASTKPVSADNSHPDGVYYASVSEGGDPAPPAGSVVFEIVQLFTGPACIAHFGDEDEDACVNDYGVETDPTAHVEVSLDHQFISVVDAATQQSYQISGAELYALLRGDVPSEGAPADYLYSGFGFLLTYRGGEITRLEQWWTP